MTPKEKAIELVDKYIPLSLRLYSDYEWVEEIDSAKQCALIAVDEIDLLLQNSTPKDDPYANLSSLEYWQQVKQEIEKYLK